MKVKIVATIKGKSMYLGPWEYNDDTKNRIDSVLESVKLGRTSSQRGIPAPDARLKYL